MNRIASFFGNQTMPQAPSGRKRPLASRPRIVGLAMLCSLAGSGTLAAFYQPQIYQLKPQDQVLILGDSTTADGVRTPGTYVRLLDQAQHEQIPDLGVVIRGLGWGGTCMHDIPGQNRWIGSFVKPLFGKPNTPTVIILNYGLNDSKGGESFVPTYLENAGKAVAELRELKVPLIDLYAAHADFFAKNSKDGQALPGTNLTRDGVHFSQLGEEFQAQTYRQSLRCRKSPRSVIIYSSYENISSLNGFYYERKT